MNNERKILGLAAMVALGVAPAMAASLNLTVRRASDGSSSIAVAPGTMVDYEVFGVLTSNVDNEGLALVGLTLDLDGTNCVNNTAANAPFLTGANCELPPADSPMANPMLNFDRPEGITNPNMPCVPECGFRGTIIDGNLEQCCGGQNTINNTMANAPFPIGGVIVNVAHPPGGQVLLTGSFTAPSDPGDYTLMIPPASVFANVIKMGEMCAPNPMDPSTFCATEAAPAGMIIDLAVAVREPVEVVSWISLGPHGGFGELGLEMVPTGIGAPVFVEPRLSGLSKIEVGFDGEINPATAIPANVDVGGCFADGTAVDLSSTIVSVTPAADNRSMTIEFAPPLPGSDPFNPADAPARYAIALNNSITGINGVPVAGDVVRNAVGMLADADGSLGVGNPDVVGVRFIRDLGVFDPSDMFTVRSDVDNSGGVGNPDVVGVRSVRDDPTRNAATALANPCPPAE